MVGITVKNLKKIESSTAPEWDLSDLYSGMDGQDLEADLSTSDQAANSFYKKYHGRVDRLSGIDLSEAVEEYEKIDELLSKIMSYAQLSHAQNLTDPISSKFYQTMQERVTAISAHLVFFGLEINAISDRSMKQKLRDKSLILVGFSGGFRRSELVAITRDDIEFVKEGVKIFVKKSKSDQSGEGMTKAIPSFKYVEYCPVDHLKNWMIENKNDLVFPISDKNVALIIKKHALSAGLDEKKYAGHSLRSGFATTTAEYGASERNIMAMTGHKSVDMVRRYIKEADLFKNNALNKISNE